MFLVIVAVLDFGAVEIFLSDQICVEFSNSVIRKKSLINLLHLTHKFWEF